MLMAQTSSKHVVRPESTCSSSMLNLPRDRVTTITRSLIRSTRLATKKNFPAKIARTYSHPDSPVFMKLALLGLS